MFQSVMFQLRLALVLSALAAGSVAPVFGREGEVLFEDNYETLPLEFGEPSDSLGVDDGALFMNLEVNQWFRYLYESVLFDDIDATVRVQLPDMTAEQGGGVGLMFWGVSVEEYYLLEVGDSGSFAVRRFTPERFMTPIPWRQSDAIDTKPGAWNELRVVTVGNQAVLFINGEEVARIKGQPPTDGSLVGLFTETGEAADTSRFADLKVVEPTPFSSHEELGDSNVLLADDFTRFDPSWGAESGWLSVAGGRLCITPDIESNYTVLYEGLTIDGDIDATATVSFQDGGGKTAAGGSLVFWGNAYDDFYILTVFEDGDVAVYRRLQGRWLTPMAARSAPEAADLDFEKGVELRVVTNGRKATLYVNGIELGTINGQPPKGDSLIGFYSQTGDAETTLRYDDLLVRRPEIN